MAEYQSMPSIIDQMRLAKKKSAYSDATLTADLNSFSGRNWGSNFITKVLGGTLEPNAEAINVFTNYLLKRFYDYCSS
ncbi:MAG: hypothetical protein KAV87_06215 [Desulfobacteraceae bacterium]|nr:hypothetical protein [Desulfobacteraceae bacterium]